MAHVPVLDGCELVSDDSDDSFEGLELRRESSDEQEIAALKRGRRVEERELLGALDWLDLREGLCRSCGFWNSFGLHVDLRLQHACNSSCRITFQRRSLYVEHSVGYAKEA